MTLPRHSPTVTEVADYLGTYRNHVLRMIARGQIKAEKEPFNGRRGFRWRIDPRDVERVKKARDNGS